jgi:16S rRNA processing protein RimM
VVKLATIDSVEDAEKLRGQDLTIPRSELYPLPQGQYYTFQIIGLKVVTTEGELLGHITEIMTTGSNDVYIVEGKRGEILIPAIEDVVKSIDLKKGKVVIEAIKGLLD